MGEVPVTPDGPRERRGERENLLTVSMPHHKLWCQKTAIRPFGEIEMKASYREIGVSRDGYVAHAILIF